MANKTMNGSKPVKDGSKQSNGSKKLHSKTNGSSSGKPKKKNGVSSQNGSSLSNGSSSYAVHHVSSADSTPASNSSVEAVDLRRVYSMPTRSNSPVVIALRPSHSADAHRQRTRLDRFGFIVNMDKQGNVVDESFLSQEEREENGKDPIPTFAEAQLAKSRTQKWNTMLDNWGLYSKGRSRLVVKRVRKGIPYELRGRVWTVLGGVEAKMKKHKGVYDALLKQTVYGAPPKKSGRPADNDYTTTKSFKSIQETIERDIHRTYPRHSMFYDDDETQALAAVANNVDSPLCGAGISAMMGDPDSNDNEDPDKLTPEMVLESLGGQASLRRVLKAYSLHDRDVGYCQGMNFIAAMFLTLMSEEESFWLLTYVMKDEPCRMRGLFGEGMQETHKVLYVAEKLIHQFLPKLSKHFDKEHIHITMFATQWLLTQYTSSFSFDLVTRVWDAFLTEGWKITYRVMLAILQNSQAVLLRMPFEEILNYFRDLPDRIDGGVIVDAAVKIPLRRKHIAKYEKEWNTQQQASDDRAQS